METKPDRYACVYTESDDFGKHQVVLLINKLATTGTFSPSYDPRPNQRFRKAGKKVLNRYRIQLELQEAAAAAGIHAAELAAGPPLGVSIKADAIVGVTIMKGVFCPDANGRWAEVLVDPDYADDTKLQYLDDGTESDYMKQHTLGKAVRSADDLIVNWPPVPEPPPEPKAEYVEAMHRESVKTKTLNTVMEWLAGEHLDFAQAVKSMDLLCAHSEHMKEEIAVSTATGKIVLYSARHLADAVQSCRVPDDTESHHIWEDSAHHLTDPQMLERAQHTAFKTIWSAMRHRRKLFGHELSDVKSVFDAVDTDGTGKISVVEFSAAMKRLDLG